MTQTFNVLEPRTTYAVALLFESPTAKVLSCELFTVSGKHPLTADEVRARAEAAARATWDPARAAPAGGTLGPADGYRVTLWSGSVVYQEPVRG